MELKYHQQRRAWESLLFKPNHLCPVDQRPHPIKEDKQNQSQILYFLASEEGQIMISPRFLKQEEVTLKYTLSLYLVLTSQSLSYEKSVFY